MNNSVSLLLRFFILLVVFTSSSPISIDTESLREVIRARGYEDTVSAFKKALVEPLWTQKDSLMSGQPKTPLKVVSSILSALTPLTVIKSDDNGVFPLLSQSSSDLTNAESSSVMSPLIPQCSLSCIESGKARERKTKEKLCKIIASVFLDDGFRSDIHCYYEFNCWGHIIILRDKLRSRFDDFEWKVDDFCYIPCGTLKLLGGSWLTEVLGCGTKDGSSFPNRRNVYSFGKEQLKEAEKLKSEQRFRSWRVDVWVPKCLKEYANFNEARVNLMTQCNRLDHRYECGPAMTQSFHSSNDQYSNHVTPLTPNLTPNTPSVLTCQRTLEDFFKKSSTQDFEHGYIISQPNSGSDVTHTDVSTSETFVDPFIQVQDCEGFCHSPAEKTNSLDSEQNNAAIPLPVDIISADILSDESDSNVGTFFSSIFRKRLPARIGSTISRKRVCHKPKTSGSIIVGVKQQKITSFLKRR